MIKKRFQFMSFLYNRTYRNAYFLKTFVGSGITLHKSYSSQRRQGLYGEPIA
jgi:hypothetical protein